MFTRLIHLIVIGETIAHYYSIEEQGRGALHTHALVFLRSAVFDPFELVIPHSTVAMPDDLSDILTASGYVGPDIAVRVRPKRSTGM